ncbi:MAG: 5'-tyrosyl-DNA phosphodiesterase, partial [uncultured bacterium]
MYRYFQKEHFIGAGLLILLLLSAPGGAFAVESFSLRPVKPPLLKRTSRLLEGARRSPVLRRVDALMNFAGLYELLSYIHTPAVTVLPPVRESSPEKRGSSSIKALSANLILFPEPFFFNQEQRIAAFAQCARRLNPDFMFLQEVWDNNCLAQLIAEFPDYYSIYVTSIGYNCSGLLILSRYPAKEHMTRRFAVSLQYSIEELVAQKGFLLVESEINGKPVYLLNTHLYSAAPHKSYRPNPAQFSLIANVVKNLPGQAIVAGDMNLRPAEIDARLPENLLREGCELPTAGYPNLSQKLDYIMAKSVAGKKVMIKGSRV